MRTDATLVSPAEACAVLQGTERVPAVRRSIPHCRQAVHDFRQWFGITEPITELSDNVGACWSKERDVPIDMTKYYAFAPAAIAKAP